MAGSNVFFDGVWQSQTFSASGTFNVPTGVEVVFIEMYGGGGGGGNSGDINAFGGEGAKPFIGLVDVTPSGSETVTIGTGGIGSGTDGTRGTDGTDSRFGIARSPGGLGGGFVATGNAETIGGRGQGQSGNRGTGGANNAPDFFGGDGGHGNGGNAASGAAATDGGLGAGGGGGTQASSFFPGDGGDGICIVFWKPI